MNISQQTAPANELGFLSLEDTQECANFLLMLKHRSVTPDLMDDSVASPALSSASSVSQKKTKRRRRAKSHDLNKDPLLLDAPLPSNREAYSKEEIESLLGESYLVTMQDRELVPDALLVAMGQMKPLQLTQADKVGCYKNRPLGFLGMACKHCGGRPNFGRYYPETLRSLAQTTTSQTMMKHVVTKCELCPPHIRQALADLQHQQAQKELQLAAAAVDKKGRPRYGSRKDFFSRIWSRLHEQPEALEAYMTTTTTTASCDETTSMASTVATDLYESADDETWTSKKDRSMSTKRSLKRHALESEGRKEGKRARVA